MQKKERIFQREKDKKRLRQTEGQTNHCSCTFFNLDPLWITFISSKLNFQNLNYIKLW